VLNIILGGKKERKEKKVNHSLYRSISSPESSRRLRLPDFETIGTWSW
jgi:hypothetical protein